MNDILGGQGERYLCPCRYFNFIWGKAEYLQRYDDFILIFTDFFDTGFIKRGGVLHFLRINRFRMARRAHTQRKGLITDNSEKYH
ncbi:hypothetical protein KBTX_04405 [wastewater metagenome]|uniref:Uncharacterized protein n=2 Tax=unclassified sequences TaxID=12908 RepID=A0A5B8RLW1_9ZZZZ|nr:hypothetical protein KBTEX_04405 [uncultured organism]